MGPIKQLCVYCLQAAGTHPDHVPPKSFFTRPRPADLVTVPCCRSCNQSFVSDDEYWRTVMSMRADLASDVRWTGLQDWRDRAWARPESAGLRRRLLEKTFDVMLRSEGGILLGKAPAFAVEMDRIGRLVSRYVRGLYFAETGGALPLETRITHYRRFELDTAFITSLGNYFVGRTWREWGRGEFKCIWAQTPDEPLASVWLMLFYDRVPLFAVTVPARAEHADQAAT